VSESKRSECSIGNNIEIIDVEESESDECVDYIKQKVVKNHLNIKHPKIHLTSDEGFELKEQQIYLKKDLCEYLQQEGSKSYYNIITASKSFKCTLSSRPQQGQKYLNKTKKHTL